jgi:hypothetical protein
MHLGADQGMSPEPLEIELTRIAANRMERRRLLSEKVMDTISRRNLLFSRFHILSADC